MPFLIDGSNLGGALAGAKGARDRGAVVRRLLPWARRRGRVVVVFDGPEDPALAQRYGPLEVRYGGAVDADAAILRMVAQRPRDWEVVTGDDALAAACRDQGARTLSPAAFLERLQTAREAEDEDPGSAPDPEVDVAEWEELFRRGGEE